MSTPFAHVPLIARDVISTPLGAMTAMATARGLAALLFDADRYHPGPHDTVPLKPDDPHLRAVRDWLQGYWQDAAAPLPIPALDLHGTPFQRAVWQALLAIPAGHTWTYGAVARRVGPDSAPRATGTAIGRNPVAVLVPCHRVIGADGSLTGYASGLPLKQRLLQHEGTLLV
ncbi:MAG: methylated-DNA--[protein]-cysteine S-methyltransferase [Rubrivivax sp.]|nr:methylated-DNA--[protein]-cysteine S-methyltransferase [Rubrivivax sp.]